MVGKALRALVALPIMAILIALAILTAPVWVFVLSYRQDGLKVALVTGGVACVIYGVAVFLIFGR